MDGQLPQLGMLMSGACWQTFPPIPQPSLSEQIAFFIEWKAKERYGMGRIQRTCNFGTGVWIGTYSGQSRCDTIRLG